MIYKKSKYGNKKVKLDGYTFDSVKERNFYIAYKQDLKDGKIKDLRLQVKYELQPKYVLDGKTIRAINYYADFVYFDVKKNKEIAVDVKGYLTEIYKLKKKMLLFKYPNINFKEVY